MEIDHERIESQVKRIAADVERLRSARERQERIEAKAQLREALLQLDALLDVHLAKEERVYLPLIESTLSPAEQADLLDRMRGRPRGTTSSTAEIDVRAIPQRERHPRVFDAFANLSVGGFIDIVSDHDPRPLSYEFSKRHRGSYRWEYAERGPIWRIRLTRIATG